MPRKLRPAISLVTALVVLLTVALPATASSGLLDGCWSTATPVGFPAAIAVCPAGGGQTLADVGARIDIITRDPTGNPVGNIPSLDMWIGACAWDRGLCWAAHGFADGSTDAGGATTISGTIAAGGMDDGVRVFLQAVPVLTKPECVDHECLELSFRSADIDGDLIVNMVDLALFALAFAPNPYDAAADYNFDGTVGLEDLAFFAAHFGHACP